MVYFNAQELELLMKSNTPFVGGKGAIVRVKIHDFMTYHKVELNAGPNVNLILGPNGTGKSTIVCAICLGLAGKPKILRRASSLKEFIRHDCNSATIEIELYNPDANNFVVKRCIKKTTTGASSQWWLNGTKSQPSAIEKLLVTLNIQLDNLCQFLPQDRVQEFSEMDACALLRSTQLAMGKDNLISKHDNLIKMNERIKQLEFSLKANLETLKAEQQYNQRQENEVKNYHERERFKDQIALLKGKRAWIVYLKSVELFSKLNSELEALKNKKKVEESKLTAMKKSLQVMETKLVKYQQEMNNFRTQNVSEINSIKRKFEDDCDGVEVRVNEINSELVAQERSEKDRLKRVQVCAQKIQASEMELKLLRDRGDLDEDNLKAEVHALENRVTRLSGSMFEIAGLNEADEFERNELLAKVHKSEMELKRLDDLRISRMKFLQRENKDLYQAVEFFSKPENRSKLKGVIHEPMILHLSVNDLRYGKIVERHIGFSDMTAFFCEDKDDLETMLEIMLNKGLRISVIHHESPLGFEKPKTSFNEDFLRKYHFNKVLVDLIEAPDYYLSFICKKHRPHNVPIGDSETDDSFTDITQKTSLQAFYTDECAYSIKKSYYGNEKCTSVVFLNDARIFTSEINATERERLQELVKSAKKECIRLEQQIAVRSVEYTRLEGERKEDEDLLNEVHGRILHRRQVESKIAGVKRSKQMLEKDKLDLEPLRDNAKQEIWKQRVKMADVMDWAVNELSKNAKKGRRLIILKRQVSVLQNRVMTKQNELEDLELNVTQYNAHVLSLTEKVEAKAAEAERNKREAVAKSQLIEPPSDVVKGDFTVDDVDKELNLATVQLGFLVETDATIVKDYEERLKKIEKLTRERTGNEGELVDLKQKISQKKIEWLEPLQNLIARINASFGTFFSSMGCAGEVSLYTGDSVNDFSKYGIKIMVKFRASQPLAEMCGTKGESLQSGGERVITTALYILALQELAVVPFRVIDEINQGMDAKNESRFFNLLCSMANGDNTPQYFLLTPKMLPPIDYPENVKFHFIMNGPMVNVPISDSGSEEEDFESDDDEAISEESSDN